MGEDEGDILTRLERVIAERIGNSSADSYVTQLVSDGAEMVRAKIIEEAYEVVHALSEEEDPRARKAHVVHEAADLIFHLMVALGLEKIEWSSVEGELASRFGVGGLEEKRKRTTSHE